MRTSGEEEGHAAACPYTWFRAYLPVAFASLSATLRVYVISLTFTGLRSRADTIAASRTHWVL